MTSRPYLALALGAALSLAPAVARAQESELAALRAEVPSPQSALRLGRALRRAGRYDEAVRTLQTVRDPSVRPDAAWEIARVRFDQGNFQPARAACGAVAAGLRRRVCMARAYLVWNRVALADREIAAARALGANDGELLLAAADARRLASDLQGATTAYDAAEAAMPRRDEPVLGRAQLYEMFQRFDEAQAQYQRALQFDAGDPAAAMMLGRLLLKRRTAPAEALPLLRRATENRPGWAEALALYGDALHSTGANAEALVALQESARISPTQPGVQTTLGHTLIALGRYADAEAPLRLAMQQVATDARAFMGLAEVLEHTNREDDAMAAWDAAIDRAPGDPAPRLRAAELAHRTQRNALARAYLDRVLTDAPRLGPALYLRGVIAAEENDRPAARQFLTQALQGTGEVDRNAIQQRLQELDAPTRTRRR